jgi:hypothetical protein
MIKKLFIILTALTLIGCSTPFSAKNENNAAKITLVSNIAAQQNRAFVRTNFALATQYNENIVEVVGAPNDLKTTNFVADIQRVKKGEYAANAILEDNLVKTTAELKDYKKWFGLHGVLLGLKQFSRDILYSTIGLTLLYLVLRIFAHSSPVILAIWNVINSIVAWFINLFAKVFPNIMDKIGDEALTIRNLCKNIIAKIKGLL